MAISRYGYYEFIVMPCGPTNALATFMDLTSHVLKPFLDKFVVVFTDNNLVYSRTRLDHEENARNSLQTLREHKLYKKLKKCELWLDEVAFLVI